MQWRTGGWRSRAGMLVAAIGVATLIAGADSPFWYAAAASGQPVRATQAAAEAAVVVPDNGAIVAEIATPAPAPAAPTGTVTASSVAGPLALLRPWTLRPYQGVGVWLDVYDWSDSMGPGAPRVELPDIDRMADLGIQTIYLQTASLHSPSDVLEPERILPIIDKAHSRGMSVVAWYLPTLTDTSFDLRRLVAASQLPVDGLGVDIESLAVGDPGDRTRRLLELSTALRAAVGDRAIAAITPSAVHLQVVNPGFWPGFPWPELGATYDVIVPMAYWSVRRAEWRQGARYIADNLDRIRIATGRPDMPIHVAGGIADGITLDDVTGMITAIQTRGALGASLYDWNTSQPAQWDLLRVLRVPDQPVAIPSVVNLTGQLLP